MCFDFFPDLSNESVNFAFVWLISGVVPEFSESIFCSDKLSYVFRKAEVRCVNYPSGRESRDRIHNYVGEILNGRIQIVYLGISWNVVIKNLLTVNSSVQSLATWGPAHLTQRGGRWHTSEE
ncbi:hypothetical protein TNCV_1455061 [Trichonephila clavipes]|nr:hypothetical protein TNCV_1455061 [Trichonephila clavipes]